MFSTVARISVVPVMSGARRPRWSISATVGSDEVHVAWLVTGAVVLSEKLPVARHWRKPSLPGSHTTVIETSLGVSGPGGVGVGAGATVSDGAAGGWLPQALAPSATRRTIAPAWKIGFMQN